MTLYFCPQLPIKNRYQEKWINIYKGELSELSHKYKFDYEILFEEFPAAERDNYFTNESLAIDFELLKVRYLKNTVKAGDNVFWADLDYPGFSLPLNFYLRQRGAKIFGIWHGAFFNPEDVWADTPRKNFMKSQLDICDKIFVGSDFFRKMLTKHIDHNCNNKVVNTGLPFYHENFESDWGKKENLILSINYEPDNEIREEYDIWYGSDDSDDYYKKLEKTKFLILKKEIDWFGYTILEALASGSFVFVPSPSLDYPLYPIESVELKFLQSLESHHKLFSKRVSKFFKEKKFNESIEKMVKIIYAD